VTAVVGVEVVTWTAKGRTFRGLRGAAPCGCTFDGRFYSTRDCTVMAEHDPEHVGSKRSRHAMAVERRLVRDLTHTP